MRDTLRAAAFGYRFAFGHLRPLWALAAWRLAVTIAILLAIDALSPAAGGDWLAELRLAGKYLVLALLRVLLYASTLSAVAIAWHRAAAGRAGLGKRLVPTLDADTTHYMATVVTLTLGSAGALVVVWLGGNGLGVLVAGYFEVFDGPVAKVFFLAGLFVLLWPVSRLVPAVSRAALTGRRPSLAETWRRTAGHAGSLLALMVMCIAPMSVVMRVLAHLAAGYGGAAGLAGRLLFELTAVLSVLVFLAALTRYDVAVVARGRPLTSAGRGRTR